MSGGGGTNTLDYSGAPAAVNVNIANGTAGNGWGGTDTFADFQVINGSKFNDTFQAGPGVYTINGNGGHDTIILDGSSSQYSLVANSNSGVTSTDSIASRDAASSYSLAVVTSSS